MAQWVSPPMGLENLKPDPGRESRGRRGLDGRGHAASCFLQTRSPHRKAGSPICAWDVPTARCYRLSLCPSLLGLWFRQTMTTYKAGASRTGAKNTRWAGRLLWSTATVSSLPWQTGQLCGKGSAGSLCPWPGSFSEMNDDLGEGGWPASGGQEGGTRAPSPPGLRLSKLLILSASHSHGKMRVMASRLRLNVKCPRST